MTWYVIWWFRSACVFRSVGIVVSLSRIVGRLTIFEFLLEHVQDKSFSIMNKSSWEFRLSSAIGYNQGPWKINTANFQFRSSIIKEMDVFSCNTKRHNSSLNNIKINLIFCEGKVCIKHSLYWKHHRFKFNYKNIRSILRCFYKENSNFHSTLYIIKF